MRRATVTLCLLLLVGTIAHGQGRRPTIGLALGVIKWCEEHHIPIYRIAGTSMGGLVGGAFASGMSAAELQTLMETTDWDMMFGSTPFRFKNIRRKEDARAYPSKIEFGLRGGLVAPTASRSTGSSHGLLRPTTRSPASTTCRLRSARSPPI